MSMFVKPPTEENGGLVPVWDIYYLRLEYEAKLEKSRQENVVLRQCLEWFADAPVAKAIDGWWADTAEDREVVKEMRMKDAVPKQEKSVTLCLDVEKADIVHSALLQHYHTIQSVMETAEQGPLPAAVRRDLGVKSAEYLVSVKKLILEVEAHVDKT